MPPRLDLLLLRRAPRFSSHYRATAAAMLWSHPMARARSELKRRGILGPDFKEEDEEQRLAEEQQGLEPEQPMVTGDVIQFEQAG